MTTTALHPPASAAFTARKGILFCPRCGHASPIDGDWIDSTAGDETAMTCPDCGEGLGTRPR